MSMPNRIDWDIDTIRMERFEQTIALVIRTKHGSGFVAVPFDDVPHALEFLSHRAAELTTLGLTANAD
jgi:hypothetical protein